IDRAPSPQPSPTRGEGAHRRLRKFSIHFSKSQKQEVLKPSLRANGSRECAPDDRLHEAIHLAAKRKNGLLRSARNDGKLHPKSFVVPAKAGTHSHRRLLAQKVSASAPKMIGHGVWVPAFAGTTKENSIVKQQTRLRAPRRDAPESLMNLSPLRGRGECRVPAAPIAPRAKLVVHTGRRHRSTGIIRHSRTQWF